ncbi:class I SAM-dependent methyltransferase [Lentibacillus cibarius]|uniref:Class I SAM-dependent methyltransferase n=1 Tax=Lentibacillus cibarius TaxID=2583219 RepID=A0A5S3QQ92_9BACI|nr:class I SAM-dependent methyltransferase [Lentibacillus cibarius]TMN23371.1 class I SAM-dependent methyltransferase [Lentibacillus cibarius]
MGNWFPRWYDTLMKPLEHKRFRAIRSQLVQQATGKVLEIGSGTGANFPYYRNAVSVDAIEPNPIMREKSYTNWAQSTAPIHVWSASAEQLPFEDDTFESVVATLVFCSIPDPVKALDEIQRVAKPGAAVLLFEHVRVDQTIMEPILDMATPVWKRLCDGCHLNRDTLLAVKQSGITVESVERYYKGIFITITGKTQA